MMLVALGPVADAGFHGRQFDLQVRSAHVGERRPGVARPAGIEPRKVDRIPAHAGLRVIHRNDQLIDRWW